MDQHPSADWLMLLWCVQTPGQVHDFSSSGPMCCVQVHSRLIHRSQFRFCGILFGGLLPSGGPVKLGGPPEAGNTVGKMQPGRFVNRQRPPGGGGGATVADDKQEKIDGKKKHRVLSVFV